MKEVYIVLTYTGTILSKIVRVYTRKRYSHVSIALDHNLEEMYSFGRLNPYNPFIGGFIKEGINIGTFKRFKKTDALIISLKVSKESYNKIVEIIDSFKVEKNKYKFNTIGLFLTIFKKQLNRKYHFYCAEFVKYIIEQANINIELPKIIKPEDFINIPDITYVFQGKLHSFNY